MKKNWQLICLKLKLNKLPFIKKLFNLITDLEKKLNRI